MMLREMGRGRRRGRGRGRRGKSSSEALHALYTPVVRRAEKLRSVVVEGYVSDCLLVSGKRLNESSSVVDFPQLDFRVHGTGEEEVGGLGKPSNSGYACGGGIEGYRDKPHSSGGRCTLDAILSRWRDIPRRVAFPRVYELPW